MLAWCDGKEYDVLVGENIWKLLNRHSNVTLTTVAAPEKNGDWFLKGVELATSAAGKANSLLGGLEFRPSESDSGFICGAFRVSLSQIFSSS